MEEETKTCCRGGELHYIIFIPRRQWGDGKDELLFTHTRLFLMFVNYSFLFLIKTKWSLVQRCTQDCPV